MAATYTQEQRDEALKLHVEHGPSEASRRTGIPSGTIRSWAYRRDRATVARGEAPTIATERAEATRAAVEAAKLTWAQRSARMGRKAGAIAEQLADQVLAGMSPRNAADAMRAIEAAVRTAQLLTGGSTTRIELSSNLEEAREQVRTLRDELAERRGRKAA